MYFSEIWTNADLTEHLHAHFSGGGGGGHGNDSLPILEKHGKECLDNLLYYLLMHIHTALLDVLMCIIYYCS